MYAGNLMLEGRPNLLKGALAAAAFHVDHKVVVMRIGDVPAEEAANELAPARVNLRHHTPGLAFLDMKAIHQLVDAVMGRGNHSDGEDSRARQQKLSSATNENRVFTVRCGRYRPT